MTIQFTDWSGYIPYSGESWGAAWSNIRPDSPSPELWTVNHQTFASLFEVGNNGARDITLQTFGASVRNDLHGGAWADFDNDGDQDLIQLVASDFGGSVTRFYLNTDGQLRDRAAEFGVDEPLKGRMPLWLDYDRDGQLDLLLSGPTGNETGPSLFRQSGRGFAKVNTEVGFNPRATKYTQISDLDGDGIPEVLIDGGQQIFEISSGQFIDVTSQILNEERIRGARDTVIADFNNDLRPDLWLTRSRGTSQTYQNTPFELRSYWDTRNTGKIVGTSWQTSEPVEFTIPFFDSSKIFIGAERSQASGSTFSLSPDDPRLATASFAPIDGDGLYINYDSTSQTWTAELVGINRRRAYGFIETSQPITSWQTLGFNNLTLERPNQLFLNEGGKLVNRSESAGLNTAIAATSGRGVVAGDFNNDGYQDVYVLSTGVAGNLENKLFQNNGDGTFTVIFDAGGVAGTRLGLGDAVTTVDINNDGFLDIMTTNGAFFNGAGNVSRQYYNDGPYEIFVNSGNGNSWMLVNLQGTISNRDGIGSSVIVRANLNPEMEQAVVAQMRERNGGIHHRAQDDPRLHFGLGQAQQVDSLEVNWISGLKQIHYNLPTNQEFTAIEGVGTSGVDLLVGHQGINHLVGLAGNDYIRANGGSDSIDGGSGQDLIVGGFGSDTLTGGEGNDRFTYRNFREGNDLITDFVVGKDTIQIQLQQFIPSLSNGTLPSSFFIIGDSATQPREQFIYEANTGVLSFDPDGIGAQTSYVIATLNGTPQLQATDIVLR